ncbi:hypothetical protein HYPSUDRAFT_112390, partial [Hypholoma sublateritium FD-334 SS-4]
SDIMCDNQLLNLSGLQGHSMPVDLNVEHIIGELKELLHAKGLEATWDRLGDVSLAIDYLNFIKRLVSVVMKLSHKNRSHSDVDTAHLVKKVADLAHEQGLQIFNPHHVENPQMNEVVNVLTTGMQKILSSTLATFNKRVMAM